MEEKRQPNERLRYERELRGWSQDTVAERVGTTEQVVSRWESGQHKPNRHFQTELCKLFEKNAKELGFMSSEQEISPLPPGSARDQEKESDQIVDKGTSNAGAANTLPNLSRRNTGKVIATFGAGLLTTPRLFGFMQAGIVLHNEEILSICATSLPIFWRLYFDGQLSEVQYMLPGYISQLALLVRQPSQYQQRAAYYASQAHQLACMLTLQEQDYGMALIHVDQALQCAQIANNIQVKVASLIRKALVYRYINRYLKQCPYQMLEAYQEAAQYSSSVSPLLQGRLYTGLSEAYSGLGQADEAKHALEQAYRLFPEKPQDDSNFSYTHFKLPQKFEAIMYLNLKQAKEAWELLAKVDASIPMAVIPDRVELLMDQTRASLLLGSLSQSCKYLELAIASASALGSDLRYCEAFSIYRDLQVKWPHEQQVKALAEHFHL